MVNCKMMRAAILWGCRFLEITFFEIGEFFEDWGDRFDDGLHAALSEALEEPSLGSITEQPCQCLCGWRGTVRDCEGGLGCPMCKRVVELTIDN